MSAWKKGEMPEEVRLKIAASLQRYREEQETWPPNGRGPNGRILAAERSLEVKEGRIEDDLRPNFMTLPEGWQSYAKLSMNSVSDKESKEWNRRYGPFPPPYTEKKSLPKAAPVKTRTLNQPKTTESEGEEGKEDNEREAGSIDV